MSCNVAGLSPRKQMVKTRHVPQRSCIVCGSKTAKRELIRIVRTPDGECVVDESGKRSGRGAYLCHNPECWHQALRGRLAHSLKGELHESDRERLAAFGLTLRANSYNRGEHG